MIAGLLGVAFLMIPVSFVLMVAAIVIPGSHCPKLIPLAFGLCFILVGLALMVRVTPHLLWGRVTTGWVIDVQTRSDAEGTTYAPVVRYVVDGTEYVFTAAVATSYKSTIGEALRVSYLHHRPGDGWVRTWVQLYLFPFVFFALGGTAVCAWAFAG